VDGREKLHLARKIHRVVQRGADGDDAVIGEEAGVDSVEGGHDRLRQRRRPERGVGRDRNLVPARHRHHVVRRRNGPAQRRKRRRVRRMGVDHGGDVFPRGHQVAVEAPLRGRAARVIAIEAHRRDVLRAHLVGGHGARRDEEATLHPHADIAGTADDQPVPQERAIGRDERLADGRLRAHGLPPRQARGWHRAAAR